MGSCCKLKFSTVTTFVSAPVEDAHNSHADKACESGTGKWDGDGFGLCEVIKQGKGKVENQINHVDVSIATSILRISAEDV